MSPVAPTFNLRQWTIIYNAIGWYLQERLFRELEKIQNRRPDAPTRLLDELIEDTGEIHDKINEYLG